MFDLEEAINQRHSTRLFLRDKPVPRPLVEEALKLAVRAPSNSNVQPWHVVALRCFQWVTQREDM
jgi:nitroreductase